MRPAGLMVGAGGTLSAVLSLSAAGANVVSAGAGTVKLFASPDHSVDTVGGDVEVFRQAVAVKLQPRPKHYQFKPALRHALPPGTCYLVAKFEPDAGGGLPYDANADNNSAVSDETFTVR